MVLVDTSVWINHLRDGNPQLAKLLIEGEVVCHSQIIGELACGNLKQRAEIISLLQALPTVAIVEFQEFLYFIEYNQLNGKGIGFVDIHLLASAKLEQMPLWTEDKRLQAAADTLGIAYKHNI